MKTEEISVAIDLDGVVFDFEAEFCEKFGNANRHMFDLHERYPNIDPDLIDEFVHNPSTYESLEPIFGGILLVNHIRRLGFGVVIMTNRPKSVHNLTKEYLEHYNVQYDDIVFTKWKGQAIEDYNRIYTHQPIMVLIDDLVSNLNNLPAGVIGIVWEQPWNEGYYPRARYNPENMQIEIKGDTVSTWQEMWSIEK